MPSQDNGRANPPTAPDPASLLRSKEAAQYLIERYGFGSPWALEKFRMLGQGGPAYFKPHSRMVLYAPADLDAWAASCFIDHYVRPSAASTK